jgi:DNA-3-methyladenine glycosylase II
MADSVREWTVPVRTPYRLDLTATVLRRLSTNVVDVFDGTTYRRMLGDAEHPVLLEVRQTAPDALALRIEQTSGVEKHTRKTTAPVERGPDAGDIVELARRMLAVDVDLAHFYSAAVDFPWLAKLAAAARGVKPPRYPTLWEAIVNAVVFQQVSIHAAAAILRRVVERYEPLRTLGAAVLAPFPAPRIIADADPLELRGLGLSVNKVVALRTLARAILDGELDAHLATFKGIGPWTAAVVALRGYGRLDSFPMNDSGVARSLKDLSGDADIDAAAILAGLGPQRGMLYYHLLIGRLAARGDIVLERASDVDTAESRP